MTAEASPQLCDSGPILLAFLPGVKLKHLHSKPRLTHLINEINFFLNYRNLYNSCDQLVCGTLLYRESNDEDLLIIGVPE